MDRARASILVAIFIGGVLLLPDVSGATEIPFASSPCSNPAVADACNRVGETLDSLSASADLALDSVPEGVDEDAQLENLFPSGDAPCDLSLTAPSRSGKTLVRGPRTFSCSSIYDLGISVRLQSKIAGHWRHISDWEDNIKLDSSSVSASATAACPPGTSRKYRTVAVGVALRDSGATADEDGPKLSNVVTLTCNSWIDLLIDPAT